MASASEVGSGNRCAATSSPGVPAGAKARSRSRRRLARVTARPRARSGSPAPRPVDGARSGAVRGPPPAARPGRRGRGARGSGAGGTDRSPRRWPGRGCGRLPPRTGRRAPTPAGPRRPRSVRRPKRDSRARMSGSVVSRPAGRGARKAASPPGGTRIGHRRGGRGRPRWWPRTGSRRPRPGPVAASAVVGPSARQGPREGRHQPADEDRFGAPQRLEAVRLDLEQAERRVERFRAAGETRAERGERLEDGLGGLPGPRPGPPRRRSPQGRAGVRSRAASRAGRPAPGLPDSRR